MSRTIGTDLLNVMPHIKKDVRVVMRWIGTRAHKFPDTNANSGVSAVIVEVGDGMTRHFILLDPAHRASS